MNAKVGGPAIVGDKLRLPGADGEYEWFDLAVVRPTLQMAAVPAPVFTVDVLAREDGPYLFAEHSTAAAFADAASSPGSPSSVAVSAVNYDKGAENLIAIERSDRMEDVGFPVSADDIREGKPLPSILASFEASPEHERSANLEATALLLRWIEIDARRGAGEVAGAFESIDANSIQAGDWIVLDDEGEPGLEPRKVRSVSEQMVLVHVNFEDEDPSAKFNGTDRVWRYPRRRADKESAFADELRETGWPVDQMTEVQIQIAHEAEGDRNHHLASEGEPAYTVVGVYLENGQGYATTVYTHNGIRTAERLAQEACREDNQAETGEDMLRIIGVIPGEHNLEGGGE